MPVATVVGMAAEGMSVDEILLEPRWKARTSAKPSSAPPRNDSISDLLAATARGNDHPERFRSLAVLGSRRSLSASAALP
jgi:hypothetical protein